MKPTATKEPSREDLSLPKWQTTENSNRNSQYIKNNSNCIPKDYLQAVLKYPSGYFSRVYKIADGDTNYGNKNKNGSEIY